MSKFLRSLSALLLLCLAPVMAQQFPDPHFEDWSGAQFASTAQPKYWNFSNVSQLGVDKNFAHQGTGRSGKCLKIQDQFVGVGSLGATSPGYVALGHPWAYVSSLTSINDATAGTYGGMSWTHRPDSMVVWIKRYYDSSVDQAAGDHISQENFHLLYYAWTGTAQGESYKAKNGSCTNLTSAAPTYCVDEESDIRLAMNGNECGTKTPGKQVAEGWFYQKKAYSNWTRISVPIYYLNDDVPQKCNVILSAGRYPEFRANTGQYAGSTLEVDDIELIYSSKIQKLYIGGREWKAFDPNNTTGEQTYSLGAGATAIPEISAVRGAGSLTNVRNEKATFPGRRLTSNECTIVYGQVDGAATTVTVKAADNSSTTTYRIKFVSQASNNARLSDIKVNGETISGFNAYLPTYNVALPYGTTSVPVVSATAQDAGANVKITQPTSVNGTSTIIVTAADGTTKQTYTLSFSVAVLTDVTLKNIFVDGAPLTGFQPSKSNYTVSLPLGTTTVPTITWESAYAAGVQRIQLLNNTLESGAQIQVSIPNTSLSKTYKITYKIEASSYSLLAGIALDGVALEGFTPEQTVYNVTLPLGTTALPAITWTAGDAYQTIRLTEGGVDGTTRIEVTAASGAVTTYRLQFHTEKSTNNALAGITVGGEPIADFDADTLNYHISLPAGTTTMPSISWTTGDPYQTVTCNLNPSLMTARLTVTAGDGSTRVYILVFEVQKSENAYLQMIYLNGTELEGFDAKTLDYSLTWTAAEMPKITVLGEPGQAITIAAPSSYGTARIVVTPEEGTPNIYIIRFLSPEQVAMPPFPVDSFPASTDALLAGLYIDGQPYAPFRPDLFDYTDSLPRRTLQVPAVVPVAATSGQIISVAEGGVDRVTTIHVTAADGVTAQDYHIAFPTRKSNNTALLSIELDGAEIAFDPAQYAYTDIELPYGTTVAPSISVERAEPEQSLVITEAPIGKPSSVVVTAEDGTQATYTFSYRVALPNLSNDLQSIVVDGFGLLDMSQGPDFTVDLPYGTTTMDIVSFTKNYPEQQVEIINGGVNAPTRIRVRSLNPDEPDQVYTITPRVSDLDPAMLTDLTVNGQTIPNFHPDVYNYVLSVTGAVPTIAFTAQAGAQVYDDANDKTVTLEVDADGILHKYVVTFYYPQDNTFDLDFENWTSKHNDDANKDSDVPNGWFAPINSITSGSKGSYEPDQHVAAVTSPKKHGNKAAKLYTNYLLTSGEAMLGFLSLSEPTVTVGAFKIGTHTPTTLVYGEPIRFRNTPDNIQLDYYFESTNKVTGWRFTYDANKEKQIQFAQKFSALTQNKWYTLSQDLSYADTFEPRTLDIRISAGQTDDLSAYYVGDWFSGLNTSNRQNATMYVDNLRLNYNSTLTNVKVNGLDATISGKTITATIDADAFGTPKLIMTHAVPDQMPVIEWSDEVNGVRTATIRNYAENLSYTDYTLTVTRPKSTNTTCTYAVNGMDLTVTKGSPYQTVVITENDTAYVITVTAESGAKAVYYAAWPQDGATASRITHVPAKQTISGESTARLLTLTNDPVLNFEREYPLDSVHVTVTAQTYELHVIGATDDTTYVIDRNASDNALLASMKTNDQSVPDFNGETYDYTVSLSSLDAFEATAEDPDAEVQYTIVPIDDAYAAVYVQVTAPNGVSQRRYRVLANIRTLNSDAYLTQILADDVLLNGFASDTYDYTISLPAHSAIPELSSIASAGASVETLTEPYGSSALVTFTVTSEDRQTTHTYTVDVQVAPSDICTLQDLMVDGVSLADFKTTDLTYSIELPYDTKTLPEVDYIKTDKTSTAVKSVDDKTVTITVTAEDGIHTTVYTIVFTIAKSTNADLQSIALDGKALASFFVDEHDYTITLPYGAPLPAITAETADPKASYVVNGTTITVTAEDGITTSTYTLTFSYLPSTNAELKAIMLDNVLQYGFRPDSFEYQDTVRYGGTMPVITWTVGDDQQVVDTTWLGDTQLTIVVTAGDGVTISEYILNFEHLLSSNSALKDLRVNGTTIEGFHPDTIAYKITYPIGSPESVMINETNVVAIPADPDATVTISMDGTTVLIMVTAPDGSRSVYVIEQEILVSHEARLKMIWMDDTLQVRGFIPDTLHYTIVLTPGANMPTLTAETLDPRGTWDLGMPEEQEDGSTTIDIFSTAEDSITTLTYKLTFKYANWTASATVDTDDYLFFPIGSGQFKAVTIGIGIQLGIYDFNGHLYMIETVPTADPSDVEVMVDQQGNQKLISASPSAEGLVYTAPEGQLMFYVFFDSKTKKIAKGGKFGWNR